MICRAKYNEVCDLACVDQFGFVDLNACLANGVVPSTVSDTEGAYNDIEDPSSILGKPADVFEAYRMQDYVKSVGMKDDEPKE